MGFVSSTIEFHPILYRAPEYCHCEKRLYIDRHNSRQNHWPNDPEVLVDQVSNRLTFLLKRVFWMILFSAEAILASSNSKFGP